MSIKVFALLSVFPAIYVINKIIKRRDLTCIDILILFQTLYMAIIPLFGNENFIAYRNVKSNVDIQLYVFFVYNIFAWLLVGLDYYLVGGQKERFPLYHLTHFIRNWAQQKEFGNATLWYLLVLNILQWFMVFTSYGQAAMKGVGSMESIREATLQTNTVLGMLINSGSHLVRLYFVFLLTILIARRKDRVKQSVEGRILLVLLLISELIIHTQISRTYVMESVSLSLIILYSLKRRKFSYFKFVGALVVLISVTGIVFPMISGFKYAQRIMIGNHMKVDDIVDVVSTEFELLINGKINIEKIDNKSSRSWNVYQIIGKGYDSVYQGNGMLTYNAITIGIPRVIFPGKSMTGSQGIIEKETNVNTDVADSLLLLGVMENRALAPFLAMFYYLLIIYIFNGLFIIFRNYIPSWFCFPLILCSIFIWLNRIEITFDNFLSSIIQLFMWYVSFYALVWVLVQAQFNLCYRK